MLRVTVGMMAGILLAEHVPAVPLWVLWTALAVCVSLMGAGVWLYRKTPGRVYYPALWVALVLTGWLVTLLHTPAVPFGKEPGRVTLSVRLTDTPHPTARSVKVPAEVEACLDSTGLHATRGRIMVFLHPDSRTDSLHYGQRILVRTRPSFPNGEQNPHQFDYRRYLRHKGILYQCYADSTAWAAADVATGGNRFIAWSKATQQSLVERLRRTSLTPAQQGIAEALLLGWRDDLDPATQQQFRDAGITHLLCVSGLHVGIVAWMIGVLLLFLGQRLWARIVRGTLQMAAIWLFVFITGMAPSTLRAGVMFSLLLLGDIGARRGTSLNNLCTSAVLLLLARPGLLFDVGFQLSYTAVLGIMALMRPLQRLLPLPAHGLSWWLPRKVWGYICLSTAAQLGTLPLTLYYFHQFPTWFLIANVTIVPWAALLLGTVLAVVLTGWWPALCGAATRLLRLELEGIDALTRWIGTLPCATLDSIYCDLPLALLLAATLAVIAYGLHSRHRWTLPATLLLLLAATGYSTAVDLHAGRQHRVVVYAAGRHWAAEYFCGRESYLVADSAVAANTALIGYQRDNLLVHSRVRNTTLLPIGSRWSDSHCAVAGHAVQLGTVRLMVIDRSNARPFSRYAPLPHPDGKVPCDILLVAPGCWADSTHLAAAFAFDTLVHYPRQALVLER